ncbi:dehydrogenase [Hahella sp. CCB-MM4]|uniref:NAD(P)/FAD-dependent oxidoreductase n=1 Tax=Hahella sp. (strain CCB-MM4) TaxID=1926491 RepID=UPI000B9C620D|nr:FAD-dependent oxidoreductase [Hahella sp. CCB-MM4]OZG75323.1 dehydrogenase [Hahella sp. CCB-MM4]
MKVAIIGGGISGLTAAYYLSRDAGLDRAAGFNGGTGKPSSAHDVTLFEANGYIGGHTDTHTLQIDEQTVSVDSGFIVFNEQNYPHFTEMLRSLDVSWQDSNMSFSAVNERTGMEYGAEGLERLFAQRRNLVNPSFYRMLWDLLRFYREAPVMLEEGDRDVTLGRYLRQQKYSRVFIENHIFPMACALWSASAEMIEDFPLHYFVSFMHNHRMLQLSGRPQWKTVKGGSARYVSALLQHFPGQVRTYCPVQSVNRTAAGVTLRTERYGVEHFDAVVFACHSDQALAILDDPSIAEKSILGAIPYQENQVVLHSDIRQMPSNRGAWASWNARIPASSKHRCNVSYWMNLLQQLPVDKPLIVTLNGELDGEGKIDPSKIWAERTYHHPVYTHASLRAQERRAEINGANHTFYCGAYWGWGFHEDGVRSALDVVTMIGQGQANVAA